MPDKTESLVPRMNTERWQRAKAILADALEHPAHDARMSFVRSSCADDTALCRDIEVLLAHHGGAVDPLEDCAERAATVLAQDDALSRGRPIGAYEIICELGHGGMGEVYLAARADGTFEKQVAIKILKRGTDTDETLRRFRAERQILAQLEHPNIARLLDAGMTDDGLPYFVMDYVDGIPITLYARAQKLSIDARLQLFLKVCAAVEFAHVNRVVHRDLKANNILVQRAGEPKLLDFGIAKLLAEGEVADVTMTRNRRLTPSCASPEQARGETVTPVSDVYALGALLYELLSDKSPHQFATSTPSPQEVARVVCEDEPRAPSLTSDNKDAPRRLRGDLDTIVLCALRKEPARRYQSVAELAEDIRRHLDGRALRARPNTVAYRAQRFVRRNHRGLAAAAIVLLTAIALSSFRQRQIPPPSARAEKSIAVVPFQSIGEAAADDYFVESVQDNITTDLAHIADLKVISRSSVASYRDKRDPREIGAALGVSHLLEGSVQRAGNRLRVNARLIDTRSGTETWAEHFDRETNDLFAIQGEVARQIVTRLRATLSPSEAAALAQQPTKDFEAYELYLQARRSVYQFSRGYAFRDHAREAISLLERAVARDPEFLQAHCLLAEAHLFLYRYVSLIENPDEQLALARASTERALAIAPDAPESHLTKGRFAYLGPQNYAVAARELRVALAGLPNEANAYGMLALAQRRLGQWSESIRNHDKAIALDPNSGGRLVAQAESYHALRQFERAEELLQRALSMIPPKDADPVVWAKCLAAIGRDDIEGARAVLNNFTPSMLETQVNLAQVCILSGDYAAAERVTDARLAINSNDHRAFVVKAQIAEFRQQPEEAHTYYEKALALFPPALEKQPDSALIYAWYGPLLASVGRRDEARAAAHHATELVPTTKDHIDGPVYEAALAQTCAVLGNLDEAFAILERLASSPCAPLVGELKHDPMWRNLRTDPRFEPLIARLRTPFSF